MTHDVTSNDKTILIYLRCERDVGRRFVLYGDEKNPFLVLVVVFTSGASTFLIFEVPETLDSDGEAEVELSVVVVRVISCGDVEVVVAIDDDAKDFLNMFVQVFVVLTHTLLLLKALCCLIARRRYTLH